jgi:pyruvate dehydrogenase E1 component alpha subunit
MKMGTISKKKLEEMYEKMLLTRNFEEKVAYFFSMGMVHGTTHLYVGEEATATGVCCAMEPRDIMASTHRGHGQCISKGIDLNRMMAEFLGKEAGYCKGKGGSMHIADIGGGNLGANGVVGGGIPLAVGAGLTTQMKGIDRIVVGFFGDGASNEGTFHESLNMASIWKLPVLFVCEDNKYGMSMSCKRSMAINDIAVRASSYGMKGKTVDGNDVIAVYEETRKAREYVRKNGPMLLVCDTYRYLGHSKSDANKYRTKEEIESWKQKDPIKRMRQYLIEKNLFMAEELDAVEKRAKQKIEDAVTFAQNSPYPSIDTIMDDVYA